MGEVYPKPRRHGPGGAPNDEGYEIEAWGRHAILRAGVTVIPIYYTQAQV